MGKAFIQESTLTDIADAIRAKNGSQTQYLPSEMAAAITAIPTGGQTQYDVLCFTAEQANSTVKLITHKLLGVLNFQYSFNNTDWIDWNFALNGANYESTTITLSNVGDNVYLRGNNGYLGKYSYLSLTSTIICNSNFIMSGKIAASGSIMSLLSYECDIKAVPQYCFYSLFKNCSSLTTAPKLPATILAAQCYQDMFNGCSSLTTAPTLPATELTNACYSGMFKYCTSLTTAPELPATKLASQCYQYMFQNCSSLTVAPILNAEYLYDSCYNSMFMNCSALITPPALPSTHIYNSCYKEMFRGCTSITTTPILPAEILYSSCYTQMFDGCTSLNNVTVLATTWDVNNSQNWLRNVSASGTFKLPYGAIISSGTNGIPSGWTAYYTPVITYNYTTNYITISTDDVNMQIYYTIDGTTPTTSSTQYSAPFYLELPEYSITVKALCVSQNYNEIISKDVENMFYIEAITAGNVTYSGQYNSFLYSKDGYNWTIYSNGSNITVSAGERVFFKKYNNLGYVSNNTGSSYKFTLTCDANVGGCLSMMSHGECKNGLYEIGYDGALYTSNGGAYLFYACTSLMDASKLIVNIYGTGSYLNREMFNGCSSLTTAPKLPATILAAQCYQDMFNGCSALTTAPELPATTLVLGCYQSMFFNCSNLNSVIVRATTWNGISYANGWLSNVASTGDFYNLGGATIPSGANGIPSGWTEHTSL